MNAIIPSLSKERIVERCHSINERFENWSAREVNPFHLPFSGHADGQVVVDGNPVLLSGSYSYLGLGHHPRMKDAINKAIDTYGVSSHGSRALTGSMAIHEELENTLADFFEAQSSVIFSNGYLTNLTTISTIVGPGDVVITELTNHNSIAAGVAFSGAETKYFKAGRLSTLERALKKSEGKTTLVVADAVFSMEGTILDLPVVSELCRRYGAYLMVDEAHSFGVLGATGRGIVEHFGLASTSVDLRMGTMSKSLTSAGGFIIGDEVVTKALSRGASGYLFTAAQPVTLVAAALESLRILSEEPERVADLQAKSRYMRSKFVEANLPVYGDKSVPIVPVVYDSEDLVLQMTRRLLEKGVFVVPALYPAVSRKKPRIRFSVTADNSYEDLDAIIGTFIAINDEMDARCNSVIEIP